MGDNSTIEEDRNMEALAESWDFLEKELDNFQKMCVELEKEFPTSPSVIEDANKRPFFNGKSTIEDESEREPKARPLPPPVAEKPKLAEKPKPPLLPKPKTGGKPAVPPKPVVQTSL